MRIVLTVIAAAVVGLGVAGVLAWRALSDRVRAVEARPETTREETQPAWWCPDDGPCSRTRRGCETGDSTLTAARKISECSPRRVAYCLTILPVGDGDARQQPFTGCHATLAECQRVDGKIDHGRVIGCVGVE
jgi:hypothetical protein